MRDKKARIKTILAFGTVLIVVMVAWLLNQFDCSGDVLPNENTTIIFMERCTVIKNFMTLNFKSGRNSMMKDVAICL